MTAKFRQFAFEEKSMKKDPESFNNKKKFGIRGHSNNT